MPILRRANPSGEPLRELVSRAYDAFDAEDWDTAAVLLAQVVEAGRRDRVPQDTLAGWAFDIALAHKFRRDWAAALASGREAAALAPSRQEEPVWWNLGIAATALRDWDTAREAWTRYGVRIPPGEGPIEADLGMTAVRICTADGAEVVWCRRLDPARARVDSVPLPGSGRRWGEIVLHDGVPVGERVVGETRFPVFEELLLWEESDVPVQSVTVRVADDTDLEVLVDLAAQHGLCAEPWDSVQMLCAACSEGRVDVAAGHHHQGDDQPDGPRKVGIAAAAGDAERLLRSWVEQAPDRRGADSLECVA